MIDDWNICCQITLRWIPLVLTDDVSTFGSVNGVVPKGNKQLPKPKLAQNRHRMGSLDHSELTDFKDEAPVGFLLSFDNSLWWLTNELHYSELALKSPSRRSPLHRRVGHRSTGLGWLTAGWWFMALPLRNKLISTDKSKNFFCRFNSNFIFINTMVFDFFFHSDFVFQSSKSVAYQWRDFFWSQLQICRASCSIRARWRLA